MKSAQPEEVAREALNDMTGGRSASSRRPGDMGRHVGLHTSAQLRKRKSKKL